MYLNKMRLLLLLLPSLVSLILNGCADKTEEKVNTALLPASIIEPVTGMEFVLVKGGCYQMGDTFGVGQGDEKTVHKVCVDDFYIGKYEVTQGQWKAIMGNNPSEFSACGDNCPVENISWIDARDFVRKLNKKGGDKYRLPTEAEWEYAARSGGKNEKWAGTNSEGELDQYAWYRDNSRQKTQPVGRKRPNALGLYDLSGNVEEWVHDKYIEMYYYNHENYYKKSPVKNPQGPANGPWHALRGGSWLLDMDAARAACRNGGFSLVANSVTGVRLVKTVSDNQVIPDTYRYRARHRIDLKQTDAAIPGKGVANADKTGSSANLTEAVTGMEFVLVKGGCYQMGDTFGGGETEEKPVHEVCIDDFYMGKYEVTQGQWVAIMEDNPAEFYACGDKCPVESVSWKDAQIFIRKLNEVSGDKYRLPTEAEWEYAARSGGKNEKWAGTNSESELGKYAWYRDNSRQKTQLVGQKRPNGLGLYDMSGNVREWLNDYYGEHYYKKSPRNNPKGPASGRLRIMRGGTWNNPESSLIVSARSSQSPDHRFSSFGFRLARSK